MFDTVGDIEWALIFVCSAEMARGGPPIDRSNSIGWASADADFNSLMQRRSSSIGLSMIGDSDLERRRSLGSLGQVVGLDGADPGHRPLVGKKPKN